MFDFALLKKLCLANGVSGREDSVRKMIEEEIRPYADEMYVDALGNLIAMKKGENRAPKKVLFDAHTDEIGFIITGITDDGLLSFSTVGGINPSVILGRAVVVGDEHPVDGVIGAKAIHMLSAEEREKLPETDKMYIDIGAITKEEAEAVVSLGDSAYFKSDYVEFGDGSIAAKAIDDRAGCAALICMMKQPLKYDTWFSFSVQEEVGGNGGKTAAYSVAPDIAVVAESTACGDVADAKGNARVCVYGGGAVVSFMDRGTIYDKPLYDHAFAIAAERGIPCQTKTRIAGGNNAHVIDSVRGGVRVTAVSVPGKYIHSAYNVSHKDDIQAVYDLLCALADTLAEQ